MLKITCARCNASLQVPPNLAGRTITCPKCKKPTLVALAPVALEPDEVEVVEIVDDADDADDAAFMPVTAKTPPKPAKAPAKAPARASANIAAKPPAKSPAKKPSRNDEAEFEPEFEMDEPAKSGKGLWIGLGVGGGVLVLALGVGAAVFLSKPAAPADPFAELKAKGFKIEPGKVPEVPVDVRVPPPVDPKTPTSPDVERPTPTPSPSSKEKVFTPEVPPKSAPPVEAPKTPPVLVTKVPTKTPDRKPSIETAKIPTKTPSVKTSPEKTRPPVPTALADKTTVADLVFETVKVDARTVLRSLTWAIDGKSFYCLQSTGKLQRLGADDLSVIAEAELGQGPTGMALSSEGLVVAMPAAEEALVVDPTSLTVRRKVSIPLLDRVTAGAKVPLAAAVTKGNEIVLFDARSAKIVLKQRVDQLAPGAGTFFLAVMTADGKYVFGESKLGKLHRLRVVDHTLVHEQASGPIASKSGRIDVSPDGNYVCLSSETGNASTGMRSFVYQVEDVTSPDVVLSAGATPRTVGFDSSRDTIYAQSSRFALIAFSKAGRKLQQYELPGVGETRQIVCSRAGDVLVLTQERLFRARREK